MPVVALVCDASEARTVVTWAGRFAAADNTELIVYYLAAPIADGPTSSHDDALFADATRDAIDAVVETIVRTRRARVGRIPRHAVSVRWFSALDPAAATIDRVRIESPQLFIGAGLAADASKNGKTLTQQVAARVPCDTIVLYGDASRSVKSARLLVETAEGRHDLAMVQLAARTAEIVKGTATALRIEASVGIEAIEVGERSLRGMLRNLELEVSPRLKVKAILGDDRITAVAAEAEQHDVLLIGAINDPKVKQLLASTTVPLVAVFRQAPQFALGGRNFRRFTWLPRLNPTDYADLYEKLQVGSRWNVDFIVMLGLATAIATLGLLQSSPAVVIGSMLLAPLMTPMIGMGLALNQGNAKLAYTCFRSIGRGFLTALAISSLIAVITPGNDLTPEVVARTDPNILDLLIALFSGMAAAYALARPSLAGTIAGVAIATAIVPPLCSVGISLAYGQTAEAFGAASLLAANILAIILAAAITFRAMGLRAFSQGSPRRLWVRHVVVGLTICALVISIPLASAFLYQVHEGKTIPIALSVTNETREAILARVQADPGVTLLLIGRPGIPRDQDPVDVGIVLASEYPLPRSYGDQLADIVREKMHNPDLHVRVACVAAGWAEPGDNENE